MSEISKDLVAGKRFEFGNNWSRFLAVIDEERIVAAKTSLKEMLEVEDLTGKSFLDIGSGSGLFSLVARQMGASVHSLDTDPQSVECTSELKRRFSPDDASWTVEVGSILENNYLNTLSKYDVVYAWGVLHHTGSMWKAIENSSHLVKLHGKLAIAVYNDQGSASRRWAHLKRLYNRSPKPIKILLLLSLGFQWEIRSALGRLMRLQNPLPFKAWSEKKKSRGMSVWHDLVDWVGGYPFEVAKPEEVFNFVGKEGFILVSLKTKLGHGNNQFVFEKVR